MENMIKIPQNTLQIISDNAAICDANNKLPYESLQALVDARLLRLVIPEIYGGWGLGMRDASHVVGKVAECCSSTALILAMHYIYTYKIYADQYGEEERNTVSKSVATGKFVNAFSVDPDVGSVNRGGLPSTTATKTADGWVVNGTKVYCSGSHAIGWCVVRVNVINDTATPVTAFVLVNTFSKGITVTKNWNSLGMRGTESHEFHFDNVKITEGCLGELVDMTKPTVARHAVWNDIMLASLYNGIAKSAQYWFGCFLQDRIPTNLNAPLATVPRLQEQMGMIDSLILSNTLMIEQGITMYENGNLSPIVANQIKALSSENAMNAVDIAMKNSGTHGLSKNNPLERMWRDIQTSRINMPQPDMVYSRAGKKYLNV